MAVRMRRALPVVLAALFASGCATKSDVRNVRDDLYRMQARQDSAMHEIQRQNRLLLDSVRTTMAMTMDTRGTTANQMRQFEQNVSELGQLVGQIMGTLARIEQRLTVMEQRPLGAAGTVTPGGGTAEQYYATGVQKLGEGSFTAALMAFEQLVAEYPQHQRAPDAQFQLGETFYLQEQYDDAYAALEAVVERWPDTERAAAALYRAGAIAEERRDFERARAYYQRVREDYPGSDEARQAQQRLSGLPRG
jgi:tol-pal system protein YbgF